MPNNKIQKLITIAKIGEKGRQFWINDTEGERYSGFTDWQGVTNTEYNQLKSGNHNAPFNEGDQALIEYTKSAGTDKEGNDVIYKNLKAIYPADSKPLAHRVEKAAPRGSGERTDDYISHSRRLALHGFVNALLSSGKNIAEVEGMLSALMTLEDEIEKTLNKPTGWAKAEAIFKKEDEPPIEAFTDEPSELDVSDVPF